MPRGLCSVSGSNGTTTFCARVATGGVWPAATARGSFGCAAAATPGPGGAVRPSAGWSPGSGWTTASTAGTRTTVATPICRRGCRWGSGTPGTGPWKSTAGPGRSSSIGDCINYKTSRGIVQGNIIGSTKITYFGTVFWNQTVILIYPLR